MNEFKKGDYKVWQFGDEVGSRVFIAAVDEASAVAEYSAMYSADAALVRRQLTDAELGALRVRQLDEDDAPTGETRSMAEDLVEQARGEDGAAFYLCGEDE